MADTSASSIEDILSSLDTTVDRLQAKHSPVATPAQAPAAGVVAANQQIAIDDTLPAATRSAGSHSAATVADAQASAQMLLRAAKQQRRLASLLPDDAARSDMLALALQQEAQAAAILGGGDAATPSHPWHQAPPPNSAPPAAPPAAPPSAHTKPPPPPPPPPPAHPTPPPPQQQQPPPPPPTGYRAAATPPSAAGGAPPAQHVRAVLRRDSGDQFKLVLRELRTETSSGVSIQRLLESDSGDERGKLREGDVLRTINGLVPGSMRFDDLKAYVRDCPGALHLEVERLCAWPPPEGEEAASAWQDGASAATGTVTFVAPPTLLAGGAAAAGGGGGAVTAGGGAAAGGSWGDNGGGGLPTFAPSAAADGRTSPDLLGGLASKVQTLLEKPEVKELKGRAEHTGKEWLAGFRSLLDAGRESLEEQGHALRVLGDDLRSQAERVNERVKETIGGRDAPGGVPSHHYPGHHHPGSYAGDSWASPHAGGPPGGGLGGVGLGGRTSASPPEGGPLARSPLLGDASALGGAHGPAFAAPPSDELPFLPNPLVSAGRTGTGRPAAAGMLGHHSDPDMDEATQLAIALSLSEAAQQQHPPPPGPPPPGPPPPAAELPALDVWGRPVGGGGGGGGAPGVVVDPFPAPQSHHPTPAEAASESDQLALALALSLEEAETRRAAEAAEAALVQQAEVAMVADAVADAARQVDAQLREEEQQHAELVSLGERLLNGPPASAAEELASAFAESSASASAVGKEAAAPPVDVADDSLIPGLVSAPVVSDTELLLSSLDGGLRPEAAPVAAAGGAPALPHAQPPAVPPSAPTPPAFASDPDEWM